MVKDDYEEATQAFVLRWGNIENLSSVVLALLV